MVIPLTPEIMFQARVDAILQSKQDDNFMNYSLKTMKGYRKEKTDRQFGIALQTITEAWAASEYLKRVETNVTEFMQIAANAMRSNDKFYQLQKFCDKYIPTPKGRLMGTKHCFLVKGGKAKETVEGEWVAGDSPLIKGWYNLEGGTKRYAHSYYFPNPNNKSGKSVIGRSWQPFNVWEEMDVKEWIELLSATVQDHETGLQVLEMQPECGDVLKEQVITPPEVWIKDGDIKNTLVQIRVEEEKILISDTKNLDIDFPQNRNACMAMGNCEFIPICFLKDWKWEGVDTKVRTDPIGSGLFTWRKPHHKAEAEALSVEC
jgi:hypothetical protein